LPKVRTAGASAVSAVLKLCQIMKQKGTSAKTATMAKQTPMTNHFASNPAPNLGLAVIATELCTNGFSRMMSMTSRL
jgi:hypothetical protein